MGALNISSNLFPYRVSLREKLAAELTVVVSNNDSAKRIVSLDVSLPSAVAFDKGGINRAFRKEVLLLPNDSKRVVLPVFVSTMADPGVHSGRINVDELSEGKDLVLRNYAKEISFRIIP